MSWIKTSQSLPPEGKLVETMSSGGQVQNMFLKKNLWWVEDGSMYVYYTPAFWRYL